MNRCGALPGGKRAEGATENAYRPVEVQHVDVLVVGMVEMQGPTSDQGGTDGSCTC